jgi:plasmid stabilization system protein ParE
MVKQIRWDSEADEKFESITEYIHENISSRSATNFADAVYSKIDTLIRYPEIGRISPIDSSIRFIKVDKFHLMFYSCDGIELVIVDFFNIKQNPDKRRY